MFSPCGQSVMPVRHRTIRLLLHFAQLLLRQGREVETHEAIRLSVETLQRLFALGKHDRFVALRELWPDSSDDDFIKQMSDTPDLGDGRLAATIGRIAASHKS